MSLLTVKHSFQKWCGIPYNCSFSDFTFKPRFRHFQAVLVVPKSAIFHLKIIKNPESQIYWLAAVFRPGFSLEFNNLAEIVWKPDFEQAMFLATIKNNSILVHKAGLLEIDIYAWLRKLESGCLIDQVYCEQNWHVIWGAREVENRLVLGGCAYDVYLRRGFHHLITHIRRGCLSVEWLYFDKRHLTSLDLVLNRPRHIHGVTRLRVIQLNLLKYISILIHPCLVAPYFSFKIQTWNINADHALIIDWRVMHYQDWLTLDGRTDLVGTVSQICRKVDASVGF